MLVMKVLYYKNTISWLTLHIGVLLILAAEKIVTYTIRILLFTKT